MLLGSCRGSALVWGLQRWALSWQLMCLTCSCGSSCVRGCSEHFTHVDLGNPANSFTDEETEAARAQFSSVRLLSHVRLFVTP